jgi:hypothetical protein
MASSYSPKYSITTIIYQIRYKQKLCALKNTITLIHFTPESFKKTLTQYFKITFEILYKL